MGKYLNRAKQFFGTDTRGLLDGGRHALLHTRSMELDDLRPYVAGDDVRDIDWRASARSGSVLTKRFVTERHHKVLVVADCGRNMTALTPSGEVKRDVALHAIGAVGLIVLGRSDEIAMVYGDAGGSARTRNRRGETHVEALLEGYDRHCAGGPTAVHHGLSDIEVQLAYVAQSYRQRLLLVVVSDEPDVTPGLAQVLTQLSARHEVIWLMITDLPAVGSTEGEQDGFDVANGKFVLNGALLGPRVIDAYRAAEARRVQQLDEFMNVHAVRYVRIPSSTQIRTGIVELNEVARNAG